MLMAPSPACFQAAYGIPSGPGADALAIRIALIRSFLRGVQSSGLALHGGPSSYAALSHCLVCLWLVSLERAGPMVVQKIRHLRGFGSDLTFVVDHSSKVAPCPWGAEAGQLGFLRVVFAHVESGILVFFSGLVKGLLFLLLCFVDGHFVKVGECQVLKGLCACGL